MESKMIEKAGFIPYFYDDGVPVFYFMIPSDSKYGGPQPGIAKGHIDVGESDLEAAYREASEELGLKKSNIISSTVQLGWKGKIQGIKEYYSLAVYIGQIRNKNNFNEPDHETSDRHWLTASEFNKLGRKSQAHIVKSVNRLLKS